MRGSDRAAHLQPGVGSPCSNQPRSDERSYPQRVVTAERPRGALQVVPRIGVDFGIGPENPVCRSFHPKGLSPGKSLRPAPPTWSDEELLGRDSAVPAQKPGATARHQGDVRVQRAQPVSSRIEVAESAACAKDDRPDLSSARGRPRHRTAKSAVPKPAPGAGETSRGARLDSTGSPSHSPLPRRARGGRDRVPPRR